MTQAGECDTVDAPASVGKGRRVIYLDDEASLVTLVCSILESEGYEAQGYSRAKDAITALGATPTSIDAFVTDLNMPEHSGLDVARTVRAVDGTAPIPLVSGFLAAGLSERAAKADICGGLPKADIGHLGRQIDKALVHA